MNQPGDCVIMAKPAGPSCNLRCAYCYYLAKEQLFPAEAPRRMPEDLLERYIAQRLQTAGGPSVHFEWHGGEPTLLGLEYFHTIVALQAKHVRPGLAVSNGLQTNGLLLDEDWAGFLADHHFSVGLSLDGPADLHDEFRRNPAGRPTHQQALAAFRRLARRRVHCDVLCVVHRNNARAPSRVYNFFRDLGVKYLQFLPLVEPTDVPGCAGPRTAAPEAVGDFLCSVFDEWLRRDLGRIVIQLFDEALRPAARLPHALCIFRETCGDVLVLEHEGTLYACDHFVDPQHRIGNLRERTLGALLEDPARLAFGKSKRETLPARCRQCDVLAFCNGGCPKDRIVPSGDGECALSFLCPAYQRFFRHCRPVMARLAEHLQSGRPLATFAASPAPPFVRNSAKIGPNAPCPCGSGRKYKKCCRT